MDRRSFFSSIGITSLLLTGGCLTSSTSENEGDADGMADEFTFAVSISGTTDHLEMIGNPVDPPLEESRERMELLVTNITSTELVPVGESGFFPSPIVLTPPNSITELRFTRDDPSHEPEPVPAGETLSQTYTAEFALSLLDRTFETGYGLQYQYNDEVVEFDISMEILTEILTMDSDSS